MLYERGKSFSIPVKRRRAPVPVPVPPPPEEGIPDELVLFPVKLLPTVTPILLLVIPVPGSVPERGKPGRTGIPPCL